MEKPLYKTTIVIWTDYNPSGYEIDNLAREAVDGDAFCSQQTSTLIEAPSLDPDWEQTSFFDDAEPYGADLDDART